jgi:hypothetical protein
VIVTEGFETAVAAAAGRGTETIPNTQVTATSAQISRHGDATSLRQYETRSTSAYAMSATLQHPHGRERCEHIA